MIRIGISPDGAFAQQRYCFPIVGKKSARDNFIQNNDLFVDKNDRVFCLVDTPTRVFFMDAVTGSLYDFGECLTSDELQVKNPRRNREKAIKILRNKVTASINEVDEND